MPQADPPSTLSRYRVLGRLEGWSVGETFNAFDPLIEREVVVEHFSLAGIAPADAAAIKSVFYREMQRVGTLTHPHVARLFDVGETADGLFATWEHVGGRNLDGLLHGEPADAVNWFRWLRQCASALEYAHLKGVSHLNLTPASVLIDASDDAKVVGFGIAPVVDLLSKAQGYTWTRSLYEAPERAVGGAADQRADWYSFAAMTREVARRGLGTEPRSVSDELERALAADPAIRTATALPLISALEQELRARGLLMPENEGDRSADSVTAVFNSIIDSGRTAAAPSAAGPPTAPAATRQTVPAAPVARSGRRRRGTPFVAVLAAALALGVAALLVGIWARSAMLSDTWSAITRGPEEPTAPAPAQPPAPATSPAPASAGTEGTLSGAMAAPDSAPGVPAPGPVPATGLLRIVSQPAGATITVDGEARGVSPVRVDKLTIGTHSISAALAGHAVARQTVQLTAESPSRTIGITLTPVTAAVGSVTVSTTPAGATLTIDGRPAGTTPAQLKLTAGKHTLRVEHDGYQTVARDLEIAPGGRDSLDLILEPTALPAAAREPIDVDRVAVKPRQITGTASPSYPPVARLTRLSGAVVLSWVVDEQGAVTDIEVVQASAKVFEAAVLGWIRDVKYEPGQQDGRPVRVKILRRFRFEYSR